MVVISANQKEEEPPRNEVITVGLDLAKNVFQVHGVDASAEVVIRKRLRRRQVMPFFGKLAPCLIGVEACATCHHWVRELEALGHEVRFSVSARPWPNPRPRRIWALEV